MRFFQQKLPQFKEYQRDVCHEKLNLLCLSKPTLTTFSCNAKSASGECATVINICLGIYGQQWHIIFFFLIYYYHILLYIFLHILSKSFVMCKLITQNMTFDLNSRTITYYYIKC